MAFLDKFLVEEESKKEIIPEIKVESKPEVSKPIREKKTIKKVPSKPVDSITSVRVLDETDLEIFKLISKKIKNKGQLTVRPAMNRYLTEFARFIGLCEEKEIFSFLEQQGLIKATHGSSQWKIK